MADSKPIGNVRKSYGTVSHQVKFSSERMLKFLYPDWPIKRFQLLVTLSRMQPQVSRLVCDFSAYRRQYRAKLATLSFRDPCLFRYTRQHGAYDVAMYSNINPQTLQQSAEIYQKLIRARFMYYLLKSKIQILID